MDIIKQFEIVAGGKQALLDTGRKVATKSDYETLLRLEMIDEIDGYIIWIDPVYPNFGAVFSDIKRKAGEGRLLLSENKDIYKVYAPHDWEWTSEDEIMYEGYKKGIRDMNELVDYVYDGYWQEEKEESE